MMIKNAKRFLSFVCALTMIATFNVCAFASEYSDDVDKPMAGVAQWHFEKTSESQPYLDRSQAKPISAFITGPGTIAASISEEYSYSLNVSGIVGLVGDITASCTAAVTKTTHTQLAYELEEKGNRTVRMWYEPSIVKVTGKAKLIATPGGVVRQENVIAYFPQDARVAGHYYLDTK